MNSSALSERHEHEYGRIKEWPHASAPGVFFWGGEHVVLHGFPGFCQQVPLRVWVAMQRVRAGAELQFEFVTDGQYFLDYMLDSFVTGESASSEYDFEAESVHGVLELLKTEGESLGVTGLFRIRSLHELKPGSGCNWSGAFAASMLGAFLASSGLLTPENLTEESWCKKTVSSNDADPQQPPYASLVSFHRTAWKLENVLHRERASGYGTLCSAMQVRAPIVYVSSQRGWPSARPVQAACDGLDQLSFFAADTGPIYGHSWFDPNSSRDRLSSGLPIVSGLIHTGVPKSTSDSIVRTERLEGALQATVESSIRAASATRVAESVGASNPWIEVLTGGGISATGLRHSLVAALATSVLHLGSSLMNLLSDLSDAAGNARTGIQTEEINGRVEDLASAIRRVQGGLEQLDLGWPEATRVTSVLEQWARDHKCEDHTGAKLTGGGGGGMMLFVTKPSNGLVMEINKALEASFQNWNRTPIVVWLSSVDGFDGSGLKVGLGHKTRSSL